MKLREVLKSDRAALREMHARFGCTWDFPASLKGYRAIEDDAGKIIMAAGWRPVPEVTLLCDPDKSLHPLVKLKGISMLHEELRDIILASGYSDAIAFVAPELKRFGRHLQREFQWQEEWPALRIHVRRD